MKSKIIFFLVILLGVFAYLFARVAWFSHERAGAPVEITVSSGAVFDDVRNDLASNGLVSSFLYGLYARLDRSALAPKAGTYRLRPGASYQRIARMLAAGPERIERSLRLVEGKTIKDNAVALESAGVDPRAYFDLVGHSANVAPFDRALEEEFSVLSGIPAGQSLEGYLFPDTYRVWEDELPGSLIRLQLQTFVSKVIAPNAEAQVASGMTWHEIITLASVVEGEVRTPEDRKIVAGIFLRRLKNGMRLQSDATLNYVMSERNDRPDAEDLAIDSPYNTYDHDGLPPGPVCNPSLSAISAVLNPTETDYYYFLTDREGKVYYARTYDEHLANKRRVFKE